MVNLESIYSSLILFNYLCVFISIFICYYFVQRLIHSQLVHKNLKLILCMYSILTVTIGCSRTCLEALHYFNLDFNDICIGFSFVNAFCTGFLQLSLLAIFLERYCATHQASSYESTNQRSYLGIFGLSIMVCYATTFASGVVIYDHFITPKTTYPVWPETCLSLSRRPWALVTGWLVYAAVTLPILPPCFYLAWYNTRLLSRKGVGTLSTRYQSYPEL